MMSGFAPLLRSARCRLSRARSELGVSGWIAVAILASYVAFALIPGLVATHDPVAQDVVSRLQGPSASNWFGTDELGRDVFSRVIYGARTSLVTAVLAVLVAFPIGVAVGLIGGYVGGRTDEIISRTTDVLVAFPGILVAMTIIAVTGRSVVVVAVVIGIVNIPAFVRVTRAIALQVKGLPYVDAARSAGASASWLMGRTLLPNASNEISTQVLLIASRAIIIAAALSFLGLGVPPPAPSWGAMLSSSRNYFYEAPTYGVFPGLFIMFLVLSLQLLSTSARRTEAQSR